MTDPDKITIIEGPPPTFELVHDSWLLGLIEGPTPMRVAMCRLRSHNAPELVERCYRAWRDKQTISLEYRSDQGLTQQVPIMAVRWLESSEGQILLVWVRMDASDLTLEPGLDDFDDLFDEEAGDDFDPTY